MSRNKISLDIAKKTKNDEFYTQLTDIEKELKHYKKHFAGKTIFCNCDDPEYSNFWKYFELNFEQLKIKKLISTHFESKKSSYKLELIKNNEDKLIKTKTDLIENGDFRSSECLKILKEEADIVVTNPPFSLFREYINQLNEFCKKFLIIGSWNAVSYKETFFLIKNNKIWTGYTHPKRFIQGYKIQNNYIISETFKNFGNILWFTNLDYSARHENLVLYKKYNYNDYFKYDNYNAINVDKTKNIPVDYNDEMGVPITFIDKYNPEQFEIIDILANPFYTSINGKKKYARII